MNKKGFIAAFLVLIGLVSGCSKDKVDTFADISYKNELISTNRGEKFTAGQVYDYVLNNQKDSVVKGILQKIMKENINFENADMQNLYKKYLNEYFNSKFYENSAYKYDGQFNEELLVNYLKSESYNIVCGQSANSGLLDNSKFTCDYTDYIEKEVNYDIYLKILKIQYIIDENPQLIDKNNARRITYYSVSKGSDDTARKNLEEYVKSMEDNYLSEDDNLVKNIFDVAEKKREEDLKKLDEEFAKVFTSSDSSYSSLIKFTTCGDKRCSVEAGKAYQEDLIIKQKYYDSKVVIKNNTEVLYEAARNLLFSDDVDSYLYKIGNVNYLVSPAYGTDELKNVNDIIMFDSSSSKYYLSTVEVIDRTSSLGDKILVAELLVDKVADSTIFNDCFENIEIEIHDKSIREYFETKYGEIE